MKKKQLREMQNGYNHIPLPIYDDFDIKTRRFLLTEAAMQFHIRQNHLKKFKVEQNRLALAGLPHYTQGVNSVMCTASSHIFRICLYFFFISVLFSCYSIYSSLKLFTIRFYIRAPVYKAG